MVDWKRKITPRRVLGDDAAKSSKGNKDNLTRLSPLPGQLEQLQVRLGTDAKAGENNQDIQHCYGNDRPYERPIGEDDSLMAVKSEFSDCSRSQSSESVGGRYAHSNPSEARSRQASATPSTPYTPREPAVTAALERRPSGPIEDTDSQHTPHSVQTSSPPARDVLLPEQPPIPRTRPGCLKSHRSASNIRSQKCSEERAGLTVPPQVLPVGMTSYTPQSRMVELQPALTENSHALKKSNAKLLGRFHKLLNECSALNREVAELRAQRDELKAQCDEMKKRSGTDDTVDKQFARFKQEVNCYLDGEGGGELGRTIWEGIVTHLKYIFLDGDTEYVGLQRSLDMESKAGPTT